MATNYKFWNQMELVDSFDCKQVFFDSETRLLDQLISPDINSVLDIGCSCGRFYDLLRQRYDFSGDYIGLDVSKPSIDRCRFNYPRQSFYHANALDFNPDKTFDLVNATGVMQHEPAYRQLIQKMLQLSSRYVMFDVKLVDMADVDVIDIKRCYCRLGAERIHMIPLQFKALIEFLKSLESVGQVRLFGYQTPFNASTTVPEWLREWVSAGILIEKNQPFQLEFDLPKIIKPDAGL